MLGRVSRHMAGAHAVSLPWMWQAVPPVLFKQLAYGGLQTLLPVAGVGPVRSPNLALQWTPAKGHRFMSFRCSLVRVRVG